MKRFLTTCITFTFAALFATSVANAKTSLKDKTGATLSCANMTFQEVSTGTKAWCITPNNTDVYETFLSAGADPLGNNWTIPKKLSIKAYQSFHGLFWGVLAYNGTYSFQDVSQPATLPRVFVTWNGTKWTSIGGFNKVHTAAATRFQGYILVVSDDQQDAFLNWIKPDKVTLSKTVGKAGDITALKGLNQVVSKHAYSYTAHPDCSSNWCIVWVAYKQYNPQTQLTSFSYNAFIRSKTSPHAFQQFSLEPPQLNKGESLYNAKNERIAWRTTFVKIGNSVYLTGTWYPKTKPEVWMVKTSYTPPKQACTPGATASCQTGHSNSCAGTKRCKSDGSGWEKCQPTNTSPEVCDGKDNDCNGQVDEKWPTKGDNCKVGSGSCTATGVLRCKSDTSGLECSAKPPSCGECQQGQTKACGPNKVGICKPGLRHCVNGKWGPCKGHVNATKEICDGKDNNCDGQIDEKWSSKLGQSCSKGQGDCMTRSTWQCNTAGDGVVCPAQINNPGRPSTCDGSRDEDCDGKMDTCPAGQHCNGGTTCLSQCSTGQFTGQCYKKLPSGKILSVNLSQGAKLQCNLPQGTCKAVTSGKYHILRSGPGQGGHFSVTVKGVSLVFRGTEIILIVHADGTMTLTVLKGSVEVHGTDKDGLYNAQPAEKISLKPKTQEKPAEKPSVQEPAPDAGPTDTSVDAGPEQPAPDTQKTDRSIPKTDEKPLKKDDPPVTPDQGDGNIGCSCNQSGSTASTVPLWVMILLPLLFFRRYPSLKR